MESEKRKLKFNKKKLVLLIMTLIMFLCCWGNALYKKNNNAKILGEAEFVTNEITVNDDYFEESRMEIDKARDIEISHLKQLIESESADEKTKSSATDAYLQLSKNIELEKICEQQIENKTNYDVLVTVNPPQVIVTVHTTELLGEEVARIKEIVIVQTGVTSECIKISVTD